MLFDHDGNEFANVTGLASDAYAGFIAPGNGSSGAIPTVSYNAGQWNLTGTGSTGNGLAFFDAGGVTSLTVNEGWSNYTGGAPSPGTDNGWAILVPVPEPSGVLLLGFSGTLACLRRRRRGT